MMQLLWRQACTILILASVGSTTVQGRALLAPVFIAQPALPYPFSAQEPYIDTETQTLHWTKHTAEYFANLNNIIASYPELQRLPLEAFLPAVGTSTIPANLTRLIRNNAGGAYNHLLFFKTLKVATPGIRNVLLPPDIAGAIDKAFGSFDGFVASFNASAGGVFGNGTLAIETTPSDDSPLDAGIGYPGNIPILGIDVWEHAYYLKHQYRRPDYIADWFNVVSWPQVNINYLAALQDNLTPLTSYP